jgi:hypothetical protein
MGIFASRPACREIGALLLGFQSLRIFSAKTGRAVRREASDAQRNSAADGSTALPVS